MDYLPTTAVASILKSTLGSASGELSELVADKLRYLRWKSAVRTLEKAREFAEPHGGLNKTPPIKFFIPFLETCSLEENDEEVIDLWANLLVSASLDFGPGHILFTRILKEITGSEARLLHDFVKHPGQFSTHINLIHDATANWEMFSAPASPLKKIAIDGDWDKVVEYVFNKLQRPGVAIECLSLEKVTGSAREEVESIYTNQTIFGKHDLISLDILVSLNLVTKNEQTYKQARSNYELFGVAYCMTQMGAAFYIACAGDRLRK